MLELPIADVRRSSDFPQPNPPKEDGDDEDVSLRLDRPVASFRICVARQP